MYNHTEHIQKQCAYLKTVNYPSAYTYNNIYDGDQEGIITVYEPKIGHQEGIEANHHHHHLEPKVK